MTEWFRAFDDSLWLRADEGGQDEAAFVKKALGLRRGQRVLDAPCGAGRIAVHLARAGCRVTGTDLRESFVRRARERFKSEGVSGTFVAMDLRRLDFRDEFHGVFNWWGSFGYFSDEQNFELARLYARALRSGGRLLIDQPNRESVLRHFRRTMRRGGIVIRNVWDPRKERVNGMWVAGSGARKKRCRMSIRLYTPAQMRKLFGLAGLTAQMTYGSVAGEAYRRSSERMITVGTRA